MTKAAVAHCSPRNARKIGESHTSRADSLVKNSISKSGWSGVGRRSLAILFSAACFAAVSLTWAGSEQVDALAQIYAGTDWYRARPEPEEQKRGITTWKVIREIWGAQKVLFFEINKLWKRP